MTSHALLGKRLTSLSRTPLERSRVMVVALLCTISILFGVVAALSGLGAIVCLAVIASFILAYVAYRSPVAGLGVFLVEFTLPLTQVSIGFDARLLAVPSLLGLVLQADRSQLSGQISPTLRRVFSRLLPIGLFALGSILWSSDPTRTIQYAIAFLAVMLLYWSLRFADPQRIQALIINFVGITMIVSLALLPLSSMGFLAGRARGIFANPNGLALFVALAYPWLHSKRQWRLPITVTCITLGYLSGSRAGLAALILEVLILHIPARGVRKRLVFAIPLLASILYLGLQASSEQYAASQASASGASILRPTNSRGATWYAAFEVWRTSPAFGIGAGALPIEAGDSYLKLLAETGVIGAGIGLFSLWGAIAPAIRQSRYTAALAAGALADALFESWLFTAGSVYFVLLWLYPFLDPGGRDDTSSSSSHGLRLSDSTARASRRSA